MSGWCISKNGARSSTDGTAEYVSVHSSRRMENSCRSVSHGFFLRFTGLAGSDKYIKKPSRLVPKQQNSDAKQLWGSAPWSSNQPHLHCLSIIPTKTAWPMPQHLMKCGVELLRMQKKLCKKHQEDCWPASLWTQSRMLICTFAAPPMTFRVVQIRTSRQTYDSWHSLTCCNQVVRHKPPLGCEKQRPLGRSRLSMALSCRRW